MSEFPELPYPVPEAHEIVDVAPPGIVREVREADEDLAAGRFVRCYSEEEFEAMLDESGARYDRLQAS